MHAVSDCINTTLHAHKVLPDRRELYRQLNGNGPPQTPFPMDPERAYAALFAEALDPYLSQQIQNAYTKTAQSMATGTLSLPRPGYVYVFRDDRDPVHVVKIGRTSHTVERRLSEWRIQLGAATPGKSPVNVLFYASTRNPVLSELVLHTLLWCNQLMARVNRTTGRQLIEYYSIHDMQALQRLCQAVTRHVDAFVDRMESVTLANVT